ncbi:hypothetical protein N7470_001378 [Penicillium chermesinum]|nr:hypothetical protein N7470_001378 [Penicillium chermesinum]
MVAMGDEQQDPWLLKLRSSEGFTVITVCIAIFTDAFIYGMSSQSHWWNVLGAPGRRYDSSNYPGDVALLTIFHTAQSLISILLAVYGASLLTGSPLFGYFADQCKLRRVPFVLGLIALLVSTVLFIVARSFPVLVIARSLQGLSAAAVWVVGLAIIADTVPQERVSEVMGQTTIGLTWGFLFGPMIGGIVYEKFGFYATFAIPVFLIILDVALRFALIEHSMENLTLDAREIYGGEVNHNPSASQTYDTFRSTREFHAASSGDREQSEERSPLLGSSNPHVENPSAPKATIFHLLRSPRMPVALVASLVMALVFSALETTLPLFIMETFHWSSGGAGLIFIASSVPSLAGVYIGKGIERAGNRIPGVSALLGCAAAWILMRLVTDNTIPQVVLLISLLLLMGLGIVVIEIISMTEVSLIIDDYETRFPGIFGDKSPVAQAYAMFNMAYAGGQLLGPILAGGVRVQAGWGTMTLVLGLVCAVTALPVGLWGGPPPVSPEVESDNRV